MVSDRFSASPESISELVEMLNSGEHYLAKHGFSDVVKRKILMHSNVEVLKLQAAAISATRPSSALEGTKQNTSTNHNKRNLTQRFVERIQYGKNQYEEIDKNKRPRIYTPTVTNDLGRLSSLLEFEKKVDVRELADSTFILKV
jgi:hypothetical protein